MDNDIIAKLDELDAIRTAADVTRVDYEAKKAEILKKVQAELDALDEEIKPLLNVSELRVAELEEEIKQEVLKHGATVKGARVQAVYYKGRISWDSESLDRYAAAHPEVMQYRKQGEPSIQLRVIKKA
jgi:uncharacterized GH25 family protein